MADENSSSGGSQEQMIPKSRLDAVIAQRDEARARVVALESQVGDMTAKVESYSALASESRKLQERVAEMEASLESKRGTWQQDRAILSRGIRDEDAADLV